MKALAKERDRRYESAGAFAADVERFLNHEPVAAGPPTAGYRLRKFVRRHRGAVLAGAAMAALLVLGTVGTSLGLVRALRAERAAAAAAIAEAAQRRDAEAQRDRARAAEARAKEEAAVAEAVNDFLRDDLLAEAAPERNARARKVTVEEVLGRAAARIGGRFGEQPRVEAAIRMTIGGTYRCLGDYAGRAASTWSVPWSPPPRPGDGAPRHARAAMNGLAMLERRPGPVRGGRAAPALKATVATA